MGSGILLGKIPNPKSQNPNPKAQIPKPITSHRDTETQRILFKWRRDRRSREGGMLRPMRDRITTNLQLPTPKKLGSWKLEVGSSARRSAGSRTAPPAPAQPRASDT